MLNGIGLGHGVKADGDAARAAASAAAAQQLAREQQLTPELIGNATISVSSAAQSNRAEPKVLAWLASSFTAINHHDYRVLVAELAAGTADPGDPQVRTRCAAVRMHSRGVRAAGHGVIDQPIIRAESVNLDGRSKRGMPWR